MKNVNFAKIGACLLLAAGMLALPSAAPAHSSYALAVPRLAPADPVPVVDGLITSLEYERAWRFSRVLYRPRVDHPPVVMRLVSTSAHLYVALENLPIGTGAQDRFVSLAFDVDHDGGAQPDADDIVFVVRENGTREAWRSNGAGGFEPDPTIMDWTSAVIPNPSNEFAWNCEIQIPLSRVGGGERFDITGFHLRHNWLNFQGDDYVWPPTGGWNVPNTWGEILWLGPPEAPLMLDVARVTQGLERDLTAREAYDFIAGKKTLILAQVYATAGSTLVTAAEARVQRVSPSLGPVRTTPASTFPGLISYTPTGMINSAREFRFWIPGEHFDRPGRYRIELAITRSGSATPDILSLGHREYKPTNDFNVVLAPVNLTGIVPDGRDWGDDLTANVAVAMQEMERHLPVRDGALPFSTTLGAPTNAGIRYFLLPTVVQPRMGDTLGTIDVRARRFGNNALNLANLILELRDPGNTLGRFDRMCILGASTGTGGGQAQNGWSPCTSGAGFDHLTWGASASVVIQEFVHCLGWQLFPDSPNDDGGGHSVNRVIPTMGGHDVMNMMMQRLLPGATSVMYWQVGSVWNQFFEGHEWNQTRLQLLNKPRLPVCQNCGGLTEGAPKTPAQVFRLIGEINATDEVTEIFSEVREGEGLDLTPADPGSPYQLLLLDGGDNVLESLRFAVNFEATGPHEIHGVSVVGGAGGAYSELADHPMITDLGFILQMPFAEGSVRAEMRKDAQVLWSKTFSEAAPVVSNVVAVQNQPGLVELSWDATDADTPAIDLRHCVFFQKDAQSMPLLLAHGLEGTTFNFPTNLAPASSEARLIVCATDGKNVGEGESNTFTIAARPPIAKIIRPDPADPGQPEIVQGVPIVLQAVAYDMTDGALDGAAVEWSSDKDGALGTGALLPSVALATAGAHTITVKATNDASQEATDSVNITVLADQDGDGLPDTYEALHPCLNALLADSGEDQDGDGLTALEEYMRGTNPCETDSDLDGFSDGDEVKLGSDPNDDESTPAPDLLFIPGGHIDLGVCPGPAPAVVPVQAASPSVAWQATAMSSWLDVQGGGTGNGTITIAALCDGLPSGLNTGEVLVTAEGGQPRLLQVEVFVPLCLGDVTGDAAIDALDLMAVVDHILGRALLEGAALEAADVNEDLVIDVGDVIALQNHIDGTAPLPLCPQPE